MPDGTTSLFQHSWEIAKAFGLAILAIIGWNVNRQVKRVDKIEGNYVTEDSLNRTVEALRHDFKTHADRMETGMTRTHERIDKLLENK